MGRCLCSYRYSGYGRTRPLLFLSIAIDWIEERENSGTLCCFFSQLLGQFRCLVILRSWLDEDFPDTMSA